jgi:hypothetical protein
VFIGFFLHFSKPKALLEAYNICTQGQVDFPGIQLPGFTGDMMNMKIPTIKSLVCSLTLILLAVPVLTAARLSKSSEFTVPSPLKIPGATLQPGSYSIHVLNRLSDRIILKVDAADGSVQSEFIGLPNSSISKPASAGAVKWANPADGNTYVKGWYFPGALSVVEFVYPKAEAVAIATANPAKVPAVDPESEGKVSDKTLSQSDMQLLTLWLLSLQQVGSEDHAGSIKAERYEQIASVSHKPVIAALPHTASQMPLVWLVGLSSLLGAVILSGMRAYKHSAIDAKVSQ